MQLSQNWSASLQLLAETSLYERELAKKLQAEAEFTNILFRLPLPQFDGLLENAQEVVVFAVAAILLKNVGKLTNHVQGLLTTINEIMKRWYQPNGVLKRATDELKGHIENTFGQFMGNCLKMLVYKDENKEFINNFLDKMTGNPNYRLYLYFRFIESVTSIDSEISYVSYRTLLNNFESTFLPRIFEALYPYFMNISDSMDINEISFLQNSLSVNEAKKKGCVLEFNGTKFTEIVFMLLEHVMTFKFNISNREYDECIESQTGMVSFPDNLLATILKGNFLDALYNVLIQLMKTKEFKFQLVCLGCLKKILLTKITYIKLELRGCFILKNMEGVFKLLKLIVSTNSVCHRSNAVCILQCNSNFISTFGLDAKLMRDSNNLGYLNQWLELTRTVPLFLLQNDINPINIENELFLAGVDTMVNLANQLKMNNITHGREVYYKNYQSYTRQFLNKFIVRGQDIMGSTGARQFTFEAFIKVANELLGGVKLIFSYNYAEFMGLLNDCCDHLFTGNGGEFCTGNLILLMRQLFRQHRFFEESVFGVCLIKSNNGQLQLNEQKSAQVEVFGEILTKTLNFIIRYQTQSVLQYHYLNNCIILFLSALLEVCTRNVTSNQGDVTSPPYINNEVYSMMKMHLRAGITDQEFLLNCLQTLSQFMHCPQLLIVQYIFQTLLECIERIKWSMRLEYFKYTPIYHEMLKLFTKLTLQPMPAKLMKLRSQLFNIITVLSFDDQLGQYRQNIRNTVILLKNSAAVSQWLKILYDLTGIFEGIEGAGVFKYFIRYFLRDLDFSIVIKEMFTRFAFAKPSDYLKDVLYLSRMMLSDKSGRISKSQTNQSIYSISRYIIPYWSYCFENAERLDVDEATIEIYIGATALFSQSHVNLCILDNIMLGEFRKFMRLLILSMLNSIESMESSAELSKALFELAGQVTKQVAKPLFNLNDDQIGMGIHQFINKLMKKLSMNFDSIVAGAFQQRLLEPIVITIHNYYIFLRDNRRKQHLVNLYNNIARATSDAQDKDLAFQTIVKIAMEFRQHFTVTLMQIASICVNLVEFYRIDCKKVIEQLGLTEDKDAEELKRIFRHIEGKLQDFEWLSYQMKDWFNMQSRFINYQVSEY